MKRFKFSMLAILAIVAMSFTLASSQGFKKELKLKRTYTCLSSSDYDKVTSINSGTVFDNTNNGGSPSLPNTAHCFTLNHQPSSDFDCNEGATFFCCAVKGDACTVNGIAGFKITVKTKS